jgi:hypothetical protein
MTFLRVPDAATIHRLSDRVSDPGAPIAWSRSRQDFVAIVWEDPREPLALVVNGVPAIVQQSDLIRVPEPLLDAVLRMDDGDFTTTED